MRLKTALFLMCFCISLCNVLAQADSAAQLLQKVPVKYLKDTEKKISRYSSRVSNKTIKTLTRLCKWEAKVQRLLQKTSPETAQRLFSNSSPSFKSMLEQYKKGETVVKGYKAGYDEYRDQLNTQLKYLDSNKSLLSKTHQQLIAKNKEKTSGLEEEEKQNEALQKMIRERKKQLITEAMKHLGKNKQLQKINKEAYYYAETIKNYKQLFKDRNKGEETAKKLLDKIPGFKKFMRDNSMLASLFSTSDNAQNSQNLSGLQTRVAMNAQLQDRIATGGPNARNQLRQNMQQAQVELNKLKDRIAKAGGTGDGDLPDFKPNNQKSKTFMQRLEYGIDFQPQKGTNYIPGGLNIGVNVGYKLNDKSLIGIGLAYKLGIGSIQKIKLSHEGLGLRTFLDWKLKKQFYITGGYEMNQLKIGEKLPQASVPGWQQSGLVGISKKYTIGKKGSGKTQLLWDFLSYQQIPKTQPIILRFGIPLQ